MLKTNIIWITILLLSACTPKTVDSTPSMPVSIPSATKTFIPVPTITITPTLEPISGGWSTFRSTEYGFNFQYPAVYDEGFYRGIDIQYLCRMQASEGNDGKFSIGVGNILITVEKTNQSLSTFSSDYLKEMSASWNILSLIQIELSGFSAITIEYALKTRSAGGIETYIIHDGNLILIRHYEPSIYLSCEPPHTGYSDYWVYKQIINTWSFDE